MHRPVIARPAAGIFDLTSATRYTIEAAIYTIRKKLGKDMINNVRGVGYVIPD